MRNELQGLRPEPPEMSDGDLRLVLAARIPGDAAKGWVPQYHFELWTEGHGAPIGHINLRVGDTEHVRLYAGHIGFLVDPGWRGHRFAARATRLMLGFAATVGLSEIWVTCNPENLASKRTFEILGALPAGVVDVPPGTEMHARGETQKERYLLHLP